MNFRFKLVITTQIRGFVSIIEALIPRKIKVPIPETKLRIWVIIWNWKQSFEFDFFYKLETKLRIWIVSTLPFPCIFWKLYWNKILVKMFFSHFFMVPQKVLRRPFFSSSGIGTGRVNKLERKFRFQKQSSILGTKFQA